MDKRKRGRPGIKNGVKRYVVLEADILARIEQLEPEGRDFSSKLNLILRRAFAHAPGIFHTLTATAPIAPRGTAGEELTILPGSP